MVLQVPSAREEGELLPGYRTIKAKLFCTRVSNSHSQPRHQGIPNDQSFAYRCRFQRTNGAVSENGFHRFETVGAAPSYSFGGSAREFVADRSDLPLPEMLFQRRLAVPNGPAEERIRRTDTPLPPLPQSAYGLFDRGRRLLL
jgi:hypothetical protein